MEVLYQNLLNLDIKMVIMWLIGGVLIYLAIKKDMEPTLLLPMGFGAILVNLPLSGAITQGLEEGPLSILYKAGIANELFPLILFIGIGAMIDFGPLLSNPILMLFGAAAQFGIFFTLCTASMFFDIKDAASIAIIGAADGPTSIVVGQKLNSNYIGAIMVAAYSYMAYPQDSRKRRSPLRFPRFPGDRNPAGATRSKRPDNDKPMLPRGEVLSL